MGEGPDAGLPPTTFVPPTDRPGASLEVGGGPGTNAPAVPDGSPSERRQGAPAGRRPAAARPARRRTKVHPVFVVTMARSGSTLLRYLLDSHPEVTSPPELNLSSLLVNTAGTWQRLEEALGSPATSSGSGSELSPEACRQARKVIDAIMLRCANDADASVFCEKSLTTVDHLGTVSRCYPKASYVFLYRHPLDLIASGIEASQWGFNAFGFAPFIGSAPGNFVAGLANYWIDRASKMLAFERTCTAAHARIYYELLSHDPQGTLSGLIEFLGLEQHDGLIDEAFERDHGRGPGDYKIDFTRSVSGDSVGRGSTLPHLFAAQQIEQIDKLLAELDYPSIESVRRGDLRTLLGLEARPAARRDQPDVDALAAVLRVGLAAWSGDGSPSVALSLVGGDGRVVDVSVDPDDGVEVHADGGPRVPGRPRVRCVGDVLLRVAEGGRNLAQATQDGSVRVEADGSPPDRFRPRETLLVLSRLLRSGH